MYCIKCGAQLADTEKKCPLCETRVYHPELTQPQATPLYPQGKVPALPKNSKLPQTIVTYFFLLAGMICLLCDLQISKQMVWSGYVLGGLLLGYVMIVLPSWFRDPNPVIFVPASFAAIGVFLLYISLFTGGGWFLSFAFPITGGCCLIVTAVVTLMRYVPKGVLYTLGGASIALGGLCLLAEFLSTVTFGIRFFGWSLYPLLALGLLGGVLLYLAINRSARETVERKLFF